MCVCEHSLALTMIGVGEIVGVGAMVLTGECVGHRPSTMPPEAVCGPIHSADRSQPLRMLNSLPNCPAR